MRIVYGKAFDIATMILADSIPPGGEVLTYDVDTRYTYGSEILLSFHNPSGMLVAIQATPAGKVFPKEILDATEVVDEK